MSYMDSALRRFGFEQEGKTGGHGGGIGGGRGGVGLPLGGYRLVSVEPVPSPPPPAREITPLSSSDLASSITFTHQPLTSAAPSFPPSTASDTVVADVAVTSFLARAPGVCDSPPPPLPSRREGLCEGGGGRRCW